MRGQGRAQAGTRPRLMADETRGADVGQSPVDDEPLFRARIASAIVPMHEEPRVASQQVSQQLAGYDVDAMDTEGEWVRARGIDGYEGWIHPGFLARPWDDGGASRLISLGCVVEA